MSRILVTGANGFLGRHLALRLERDGHALTLAQRSPIAGASGASSQRVSVGDVGPQTEWAPALEGCDTVIHLAGQLPASNADPAEFRQVNEAGTARLVGQAVGAGVKRFVFLSSVAAVVTGSATSDIDEQAPPSPVLSAYGQSKRAAEEHVAAFAAGGRQGISIRPPIVYGADAGGTWAMLQRLAASRLPLPFGAIRSRRSLVAVDNLVDAITSVVAQPPTQASSGAYFVADDKPVSVREVFVWLREGMGISSLLLPVPAGALAGLLRVAGRERIAQQLLGELVIDASLFRRTFGWAPATHPREAVQRSGAEYRAIHSAPGATGKHSARSPTDAIDVTKRD